MKRLVALILISAAAGAAQGLPQVEPRKVGLSPERLARIDSVMKEHISKRRVAGAVALIARNGRVAYLASHGMADMEASKPMRADTIFRIASMTKPITSVAVMMLYEEGKFLLTDPVSRFIPEFKNVKVLPTQGSANLAPVTARREITIRHLLTHTSGLSYHWNNRLGRALSDSGVTHGLIQDESTLAEKMKVLAAVPLLHHPGDAFEYGLSVDVLGRVVEVASGMTLDEFFRKRIFDPLGMKDTHFFLPEDKVARLAAVYEGQEGEPIRRAQDGRIAGEGGMGYSVTYPYQGPRRYYSGGGGLVSTAGDYARFAQMMLNGGQLDGVRLLSPKTVEFIRADQLAGLRGAPGFGLGFGVARDTNFSEIITPGTYGWGGFFYTDFGIDPKERMVSVYMSQLHPTGGLRLAEEFRALAYQAIVE